MHSLSPTKKIHGRGILRTNTRHRTNAPFCGGQAGDKVLQVMLKLPATIAHQPGARKAKAALTQAALLRIIDSDHDLARQTHRYLIERHMKDYPAYVQVLKIIRREKLYSSGTNVTNLRSAFLKAYALVDI